MGMFDHFCVSLTCPLCGWIPTDPCAIAMQSKIDRAPSLRRVGIGDALDVDVADPDLFAVGATAPTPGAVTIAETWSCGRCGASFLWARVTVRDGRLAAMAAIELDRGTLAACDFITAAILELVPPEAPQLVDQVAQGTPEARRHLIADLYRDWVRALPPLTERLAVRAAPAIGVTVAPPLFAALTGALTCPACGAGTAAPTTRLDAPPLFLGPELVAAPQLAGLLALRDRRNSDGFTVLDVRTCGACATLVWGLVTVARGQVVSIERLELVEASAMADLITPEANAALPRGGAAA